jgi:hypothetical protein
MLHLVFLSHFIFQLPNGILEKIDFNNRNNIYLMYNNIKYIKIQGNIKNMKLSTLFKILLHFFFPYSTYYLRDTL